MCYIRHVSLCFLLLVHTVLCAQRYEVKSAQEQLMTAADTIRYIDALNKLSVLYLGSQLDSGGQYARTAYTIAARKHYQQGMADAAKNLGRYYLLRPQVYLATRYFDHALSLYRESGDSVGVALTLAQRGICYLFQKNQPGAESSVTAALKCVPHPSDSVKCLLLTSYYNVYHKSSVCRHVASEALKEASRLASGSAYPNLKIYTQLYVANELMLTGNVDSAIGLLKKTLQQSDNDQHTYMSLYACEFLSVCMGKKRDKDSLYYQQKMIEYGVKGGYTGLILETVNKVATSYLQKEDNVKAAKYSRIALQIMQQQQAGIKEGEADWLSYFFGDERLKDLKLQHQSQYALLVSASASNKFVYYQIILIVITVLLVLIVLSAVYRAYKLSYKKNVMFRQWQQELTIDNTALVENDDFKNKLISMVAHDFRTPLHNIVSITGFVNEQVLTVNEAAAMIKQVDKTAEYTLQLFEEISGWISTQLSGFQYKPVLLSAITLIRITEESLKIPLVEKNIKLQIDIPQDTMVWGDFEMLQFIHRNFLHNAIKFSPDNGLIKVYTKTESSTTGIYFMDEGSGVDQEILPRLFAWNSITQNKERVGKGAGLALIICKDFTEKMNGEIGAFNNEEEGSTFYYKLPKTPNAV